MRSLSFLSITLLGIIILCCKPTRTTNDVKQSNYIAKKIDCNVFHEESFDSTFSINGENIRLICKTECLNDFIVPDTINDSIINLYQDRLFKFTLKNYVVDTQFVVTKELIKDKYPDINVYLKSLLVYPRIDSIDTAKNAIIIHSAFMYPNGLEGTDFFESVLFEISARGKVKLIEIQDYEEPGLD
jgi:hypothetical protein